MRSCGTHPVSAERNRSPSVHAISQASWSATNVYKSTEEVYAGSYSLKTTQSAWGAFSVHSGTVSAPVNIHPSDYSHFEFAIYNTTSGLNLNVYCYNDSGNTFPNVMENNIPTNQWTIISVPITQLDPNKYPITRINIQNYTRLSPVYYVDNVHFVDSVAQAPMAPTTTLPLPGAEGVSISPVLTWEGSPGAVSYRLQVALNTSFTPVVLDDSTITATYRQVPQLSASTAYYWRVAAKNSAGTGSFSQTSSFVTALGNTLASYSLTSLNFGVLHVGTTQVDSLTVRNTGSVVNLVISGIASTDSEFAVSPQSATIVPGGSQVFAVSAHPTQSQPVSGYLLFTVNTAEGLDSVAVQISGVTDVVPNPNLPTQFSLNQNYPNPFNPSTIITFALPTSSYVTLKIYDILGREIATIVNEQRSAGEYREKFAADNLPSGLYIYRLRAGGFSQTGKMMLLK